MSVPGAATVVVVAESNSRSYLHAIITTYLRKVNWQRTHKTKISYENSDYAIFLEYMYIVPCIGSLQGLKKLFVSCNPYPSKFFPASQLPINVKHA